MIVRYIDIMKQNRIALPLMSFIMHMNGSILTLIIYCHILNVIYDCSLATYLFLLIEANQMKHVYTW